MVAAAFAERNMDFADALHLGRSARCDALATFDRKPSTAAKAAGFDHVREA